MGTEVASSEDNFAEAEKAKDLVMKDRLVLKRKREEVDTLVTSLQKYEDGELQEPPTEAVLEYLNQVGVEEALGAWAVLDVAADCAKESNHALTQAKFDLKKAEKVESAAIGLVEASKAAVSTAVVRKTL